MEKKDKGDCKRWKRHDSPYLCALFVDTYDTKFDRIRQMRAMKPKKTAKKGKRPSRNKAAGAGKEEKGRPAKVARASGAGVRAGRIKKSAAASVTARDKGSGGISRQAKTGVRPDETARPPAPVHSGTHGKHPAAIREIVSPELPEEYGENEFFLIPVEPRVVYASWEITKDALPGEEDELEVRFFEVTKARYGEPDARAFLGIDISKRVGSAFFNVGIHGREIIAEIGHLGIDGHFTPLLRSRKVLIPTSLEADHPEKTSHLPDTGGYGSRPPDR